MPATASPDSSESPRRLVVDVLKRHGSCTTLGTTGFYWQQLEPIRIGQARCSPLQVMLWLGRLCSLLIADSGLAGYCQQSAHVEAVFLLQAFCTICPSPLVCALMILFRTSLKIVHRYFFWGGMSNLAKSTHKNSLLQRANTARARAQEKHQMKKKHDGPSLP